jgi:hypothetical protein
MTYTPDVIGFKYFSAQGKGKADAGFAYRYAYFDGHCPATGQTVPRDCGIRRSENLALLDGGRMHYPISWDYENAVAAIKEGIRGAFEQSLPEETRGFIDNLVQSTMNQELDASTEIQGFFDGVTTD